MLNAGQMNDVVLRSTHIWCMVQWRRRLLLKRKSTLKVTMTSLNIALVIRW